MSGRDQAADGAIRELIEACREGRGGALLLVGPQSVRTVEAEASRSHVSVVRAAARAGDREFGLVRRLIEPLVAGRHGDDPIFAGVGGYAWERVDRAADETGHEDHESLVYGLAWLLRLLSQEADPRILLAEGPEAADAGSLRVLQVLSRQARSHGPAIVTVSKEAGHADVPGLEGFESPDEAVLSSAPPSGSLDLPRLREQLDRTVDPDLRAEMLFRLVGGLIEVGQAGSAADLAEAGNDVVGILADKLDRVLAEPVEAIGQAGHGTGVVSVFLRAPAERVAAEPFQGALQLLVVREIERAETLDEGGEPVQRPLMDPAFRLVDGRQHVRGKAGGFLPQGCNALADEPIEIGLQPACRLFRHPAAAFGGFEFRDAVRDLEPNVLGRGDLEHLDIKGKPLGDGAGRRK